MALENFTTIEGTPGLQLGEVAHALILGRGRTQDGMDLDPRCEQRVDCGVAFFNQYMAKDTGVIVCSGYKTPADKAGMVWRPIDESERLKNNAAFGVGFFTNQLDESFDASNPRVEYLERLRKCGERFRGIPEAYSMFAHLLTQGIPGRRIRVEPHSICTVTNFARAEHEGHFGKRDERPVAIISQAEHLERALDIIARRVLRRPFIGIVAPEFDPHDPDHDNVIARSVSRLVVAGIKPDSYSIVRRTHRRSTIIWGCGNVALSVAGIARRALVRTS